MPQLINEMRRSFALYKSLGDKTFAQLSTDQLLWQPNAGSNSIAIIIQHLHGNMLSRWTDFLTTNGEKPWRERDQEFEPASATRDDLLNLWETGWKCLFDAVDALTEADLQRRVHIRNEAFTVTEATAMQLAHAAYHVGQMVFIGKLQLSEGFVSLSTPKGASKKFHG